MEREKSTKALTSSRVLLHVLLMQHDLVTCALLFFVYFSCCYRWENIYYPWINQHFFRTYQKKILLHPLMSVWNVTLWNILDENLFSLVLKADNSMFPCLLPFSESASAESQDFIPCYRSNRFQMPKRNMGYGIWHMVYFHVSFFCLIWHGWLYI